MNNKKGQKINQNQKEEEKIDNQNDLSEPENEDMEDQATEDARGIERTQGAELTDTDAKPLTTEVHFPRIFDLKQALSMDTKGFMVLSIGFKVTLENTFELFRLANLLKQKGTSIFATIGSNQTLMDFTYDPDENVFQIIKPEDSSPDRDTNETSAIDSVTEELPESSVNPPAVDREPGNEVEEKKDSFGTI